MFGRLYICSSAPTVHSALYNIKGRQYSYNTIKYNRIKRALLRRAYRWYKKVVTVGNELMEVVKD